MNLRDLEYVVAVADFGHFGRAAEACGVSQPTLSTQIQKLERELGLALFERGSRQVILTPTGAEIVERSRRILSDVADVRALALRSSDPARGVLRLGLFPTVAPYLLPHLVGPMKEAYPDLEARLIEEKTDVLREQLRTGRIDAAILARPVEDPAFTAAPLFTEDFVLAAPANWPLVASGAPVGVRSLGEGEVLLLEEGHCMRDHALSVCAMAEIEPCDEFRATSLETLRHMVAAGLGMTLLPMLSVIPPVRLPDGLRVVAFEAPAPARELALFWRASSPLDGLLTSLATLISTTATHVLSAASMPA